MTQGAAFIRTRSRWWGALVPVLLALGCGQSGAGGTQDEYANAEAPALYANMGRQSNQVRACFVLGPTPSTVTQATLDEIRSRITEWSQGDTSLSFTWSSNLSTMQSMTFGSTTYLTSCTRNATTGVFNEQFRIYVDDRNLAEWSAVQLPRDLPIPGTNCTGTDGIGSQAEDQNGNPIQDPVTHLWQVELGYMYSWFPDDMVAHPTCLYTSHMYPGQARNNYIHESGHGLGLAHEQGNVGAVCSPEGPYGIPITVYDRDSPMHYVLVCPDGTTTPGNWGNGGLTDYDRLAIEIMYPQWMVSRIDGQLVGWSGGDVVWAAASWERRGAYLSNTPGQAVLRYPAWYVDGRLLSTQSRPSSSEWATVGTGRHTLTLQYSNLWGDNFSGSTVVELLATQAEYDARVAATFMPFL